MISPIPYHDFGGQGPLLHFSHPNGYTPPCFRQLMAPLTRHYRAIAAYHRPLWPGSHPSQLTGWQMVADDMLRFFAENDLGEVVGVGHSLGAVATMYAALKSPEHFSKLVLIEPIFLPPPILQLVAADPDSLKQLPLIRNTFRRRNRWPSREAAFKHFRAKEVFENWDDSAIWDYVNYALHDTESGEVVLTYTREWEVHFYMRPPMDVWEVIPRITQPTLAIRAAGSDALFAEAWRKWQEIQPQASFVEFEDVGHMLVMERPAAVAERILGFLRA